MLDHSVVTHLISCVLSITPADVIIIAVTSAHRAKRVVVIAWHVCLANHQLLSLFVLSDVSCVSPAGAAVAMHASHACCLPRPHLVLLGPHLVVSDSDRMEGGVVVGEGVTAMMDAGVLGQGGVFCHRQSQCTVLDCNW